MVLITFDNDFAELVYRHKRKAYGVILLKFVPNSLQQISEVVLNEESKRKQSSALLLTFH
jgi:predicted nuclease of predicted toxin-antitoxin system